MGVSINDLFKVEVKPEYIEGLRFICNSRSRPWPPLLPENPSEKDIMYAVRSRASLQRSDHGENVSVRSYTNAKCAKVQ